MIRILSFIFLVLIVTSCNKKNENKKSVIQNITNDIVLDLPDNIFINEIVNDTVYYSSPLDTINLTDKDKRFTIFYVSTDTINYSNIKEIVSGKHEMFIEKEKGIIPFAFKFEKLGDNYFTGIIEDQVILDNYQNGKARIITHESVVTVKVWIKEREIQKI